jgi:pSer/pThr/pTyr-binding forkhead associated (FHA) protein
LQPQQLTKTRPLFIGRVPPVDEGMMIQLEESHKTVSRNHAELFVGDDGNPYLRDMGSLNGSYVNGQKVVPFAPTMLKTGDEVAFSRSLTITIT